MIEEMHTGETGRNRKTAGRGGAGRGGEGRVRVSFARSGSSFTGPDRIHQVRPQRSTVWAAMHTFSMAADAGIGLR